MLGHLVSHVCKNPFINICWSSHLRVFRAFVFITPSPFYHICIIFITPSLSLPPPFYLKESICQYGILNSVI